MKKLTIGAILFALSCWALPIQTAAQVYGTNTQTSLTPISEVHDPSPAQNADSVTSERGKENEGSKKEVNDKIQTSRRASLPNNSVQPSNSYGGRVFTKEEVQQLIKDYSAQYGISADLPLRVANCESGYNQFSKNKHSTASGVFQYLSSTWHRTLAGKAEISVFDADANVHMAIKSIASGGISNWAASAACWNK